MILLFGALLIGWVVYLALFSGGHSRAVGFSIGNIYIDYEVGSAGSIRPERLERVIFSAGPPDMETINSINGGPAKITRTYRGRWKTNTISFTAKPGQIVWIDKDGVVYTASIPLRLSDIATIEKHRANKAFEHIASVEDLNTALSTMRAETH